MVQNAMATVSTDITDWKRLWQLVSGIHYETPESTVRDELFNVSKQLQDGILQFCSRASSKVNLEELLKEKKQEKLLPFTQSLQYLLDLESKQCWGILCYYLTNEYRGSASTLTSLISTESSTTKLLDDIWGYYSLERIIVLKILKNLLIFYKTPTHPYQAQYKEIVDKITMEKLRESYLCQLEHLLNECPPSKLTSGEFFDYQVKIRIWAERNAREINEVLHIILLICEHLPVSLAVVKTLFTCFKKHSFGLQKNLLDVSNPIHKEVLTRITYSEVVLLIKCFDLDATAKKLATDIIDSLDHDIMRMYHNPENGPLLLAWMLLKLRFTNIAEDENRFAPCRAIGRRAVDLNCFEYMHTILTNSMFKDDSLVSRVARKCIYNLLCSMCDIFDGSDSCARYPSIYKLLCELLSWSTIAKDFCEREDKGVRPLFNYLLETFPLHFGHLSNLANALTSAGMSNFIRNQMESLPIFTEFYDYTRHQLNPLGDDEYELIHCITPFPRIDFVIPINSIAVIVQRPEGDCVHFRVAVNYFEVLHNEINCLLSETIQQEVDWECNERVSRVNAGLEYLQSVLQRTKAISAITAEMVHPTEMCIDLLNKFKVVSQPPIKLLANCMNVCTTLLSLVDEEIFTRIVSLHILPVVTNESLDDYKQYALGKCFDSRLIGTFLVDVEKKLERYELLTAYLSFLRTYTKLQRNRFFQVEIPGLIFLLREVFPHVQSWGFRDQTERYKIYTEIMGFICDILDTVTSISDKNTQKKLEKQLLRDICIFSLLNLQNGLVLLKFVAVGNAQLQWSMEMETNWMIQQSHGIVLLVRLSMRILMQVLRLKATAFEGAELSPLEALSYTQPKQRDSFRIVPVVTSYMSNIFDRWLPILSCRLLRRIALEFNMSLLACLDMTPDQIRLTFLQRLPDELESDSLKIAILELVEACIEKQPGVTEAFFKINSPQDKRFFGKEAGVQIADSIITYLEDYLEAVDKDPKTVENALPGKIMNLFHSLWRNNMQGLVEELTKKPKFWTQLCNPLFTELGPDVRVHTQLLNILALEIFCSTSGSNDDLKKIILRFFEEKHFNKWIDGLFILPKIPATMQPLNDPFYIEMPQWLCRLHSFKSFLIILLKKQPPFIAIPNKPMKTLAERSLLMLVERAEYLEDLRPFLILSELYLFALLSFKHSYTESSKEDRAMLEQIIKLLKLLPSSYEDLQVRAKEACLAITIKCTDLLAAELHKDAALALSFLHSVVCIICIELQSLENWARAEKDVKNEWECLLQTSSNSLVLSLNLLKTVATVFHNDGPDNWDFPFIVNKVFQRLLSCTGSILQSCNKQVLSIGLLDVLIVFAKGNCSSAFLHCDVSEYLWLKLLPPKDLLQANFTLSGPPQTDAWTVQKWWPIYARGVELVTILFNKHKYHFINQALQFVGIHEEYLVDSLLLGKQTLEPKAIELIKSTISLMANLVEFELHWRLEHSQSLFNLMRAVQILLGYSISMFHQPKNVKCLVAGRGVQMGVISDQENPGFAHDVISAFNNLTEIVILSVKCLQRFSPDLLHLICEPELVLTKWEQIFDVHFGAPKLNETMVTLTFGSVLSIVSVFTKVLNLQGYGFHEVPLNIIPKDGDSQHGSLTDSQALNREPRQFSKSISITSVSSVNCPPNELLSTLDTELCLLALEHILMLAASQSMLALKNPYLPSREKQIVRREINTELIIYYEFVRKKVLIEHREHREMWHRRKHGLVPMPLTVIARGTSRSAAKNIVRPSSQSSARRSSTDLRVNVVRRLHLQQEHTRNQQEQQQRQQQQNTPTMPSGSGAFEMSRYISPIGAMHPREPARAVASTPNLLTRSPLRRAADNILQLNPMKRNYTNEETCEDEMADEEEIQYFAPDEPGYSPLSYVQLVEEDYLHCMSNLFTVICQSD